MQIKVLLCTVPTFRKTQTPFTENTPRHLCIERSTCSQGLLDIKFLLQSSVFLDSSKRKGNTKMNFENLFVAVGDGEGSFLLDIWYDMING